MALTKERDTKRREYTRNVDPLAAGAKIFQGALVCLDATGNATKGAVATTLIARGRALETVDNTGGSAGAKSISSDVGVFLFDNHGTNAVTRAHINKDCYIADDHTVAGTDGGKTRSKAGIVRSFEGTRVWVEIR